LEKKNEKGSEGGPVSSPLEKGGKREPGPLSILVLERKDRGRGVKGGGPYGVPVFSLLRTEGVLRGTEKKGPCQKKKISFGSGLHASSEKEEGEGFGGGWVSVPLFLGRASLSGITGDASLLGEEEPVFL